MKTFEHFHNIKRGLKGRRSMRRLSYDAVIRAQAKSKDPQHRWKFIGRGERDRIALQLALAS